MRGMRAPFGGDGCCGLYVLLSQSYWLRTIAFCREQSFLCTVVFVVHCCIGCEPVVFSVDCWLAVRKEQRVSGL
jgi:hypothetical protein